MFACVFGRHKGRAKRHWSTCYQWSGQKQHRQKPRSLAIRSNRLACVFGVLRLPRHRRRHHHHHQQNPLWTHNVSLSDTFSRVLQVPSSINQSIIHAHSCLSNQAWWTTNQRERESVCVCLFFCYSFSHSVPSTFSFVPVPLGVLPQQSEDWREDIRESIIRW